jgi:hypothetical protein
MAELDSTLLDMSPDRINDHAIIQVKLTNLADKGDNVVTEHLENPKVKNS